MAGHETLARALTGASILIDEQLKSLEARQLQSLASKRIHHFTRRSTSLRSKITNIFESVEVRGFREIGCRKPLGLPWAFVSSPTRPVRQPVTQVERHPSTRQTFCLFIFASANAAVSSGMPTLATTEAAAVGTITVDSGMNSCTGNTHFRCPAHTGPGGPATALNARLST